MTTPREAAAQIQLDILNAEVIRQRALLLQCAPLIQYLSLVKERPTLAAQSQAEKVLKEIHAIPQPRKETPK